MACLITPTEEALWHRLAEEEEHSAFGISIESFVLTHPVTHNLTHMDCVMKMRT